MIHLHKNRMPVSINMFSVQLKLKQCLPGLRTSKNKLDLLVNQKKKNPKTSLKTSNSSQTASDKTSISSTTKNNVKNKTSKSQLSKGRPHGHDKLIKDPVQVHNRYGHLDDSEEESEWNLPPDDSPPPMDESPSETRRSPKGGLRKGSQRKTAFPRSDAHDGSNHSMELSRSKG
jgi:hypothetical protein